MGAPAVGPYVADKGFEGQENHEHWRLYYGAQVIYPPKRNSRHPWPKQLRRWLASIRQMLETVYDKLIHLFRLAQELLHRFHPDYREGTKRPLAVGPNKGDIVPNEGLPVEAYILPEIFTIEMNPRHIRSIDDFYFILAHEVVHWVFPDVGETHADNIAAEAFINPTFRRLVRESFGIPDWVVNKEDR